MNLFELVTDVFKTYSETKGTALHVGEVMNLWTLLEATENFMNSERIYLNKVEDKELEEKIKDLTENYHKVMIGQIKKILLDEGVQLPAMPVEKPKIKLSVPPGAQMTDKEVANFVVFNVVWAIKFCTRGMTESVRADIGTFFLKWINFKGAYALTMKELMKDKGWLLVPPTHKVNGSK